ncbi:MAG: hypothetical protein PUF62_02495 [Bacteroidales bacterium]|nr:hypothetical protein [Bacteroidales bacterium]
MKLKKLFTWALVACMSVSLTSCFNTDEVNDSMNVIGIFKSGIAGYYVETVGDKTVTPTSSSVANLEANSGKSLSKFVDKPVFALFTWDSNITEVNLDDQHIKGVDLNSLVSLENDVVEIVENKGDLNDSIATHPIIGIGVDNVGSEIIKPTFMPNSDIVLLPINYYLESNHYLTMVYYVEENEGESAPIVHLRNSTPSNDNGYAYSSYDYYQTAFSSNIAYIGTFYRGYNLEELFYRFESQNGFKPNSIVIEYDYLLSYNNLNEASQARIVVSKEQEIEE